MKNNCNASLGGGQKGRHAASNTVLLLTLLVTPLLRKPVSNDHLHFKITIEKAHTTGLPQTQTVMQVDVGEELIRVGYITLLLLAGLYIRKKENDGESLDDRAAAGMTMTDKDILEAWEQIRRQLSTDDEVS